jgi:glycosyltransferase involved in cell wall biosynthesis
VRRIAWWSPLPPQASGIADYSFSLLEPLASRFEITAVVSPRSRDEVRAPDLVDVIDARDYDASRFDLDVYHFGNDFGFHGYMHTPVLRRPGLMVLHDPSLVDFYVGLCGGWNSALYHEEIRINRPDDSADFKPDRNQRWENRNRLELLLSKRLIESSLCTVVHSAWAKGELSLRSPTARLEHVWLGSYPVVAEHPSGDHLTFTVLGGIARHKRLIEVLSAFRELRDRGDLAVRLIIAGRVDDPGYLEEVLDFIAANQMRQMVEVLTHLSGEEFDQVVRECDVVVALRWPTAGETSSVVMRAFGAAKVVVASDVPQNRDFDRQFCLLVSVNPEDERGELVAAIEYLAEDPTRARSAGEAAREFVRREASFDAVAERYARLIDEIADTRVENKRRQPGTIGDDSRELPRSYPTGVNAIGNWSAATGLAEAGRRAVGALLGAGVAVSSENFETGVLSAPHRTSEQLTAPFLGRCYDTDLYFLNIHEMSLVSDEYLEDEPRNRYRIGSWFWELPNVPARFAAQLRRLDEVWVASEFVKESFQGQVGIPIEVMPCVVEPRRVPPADRSALGLPSDRCVLLYHFDANSTIARKNPLAVIEAFHRAFPRQQADRPLLVLKTQNLGALEAAKAVIEEQMASIGGLLIDGEFTGEQMSQLLMSCDMYVSLHRAEGFGLGMAEAMYYGKPVIATAFSGNMEFCSSKNSALVGYEVTEVDATELSLNPGAETVYQAGALWAEPDIDQAARWMRALFEDDSMRTRLGVAAAATIRRQFNAATAGRRMATRLFELGRL